MTRRCLLLVRTSNHHETPKSPRRPKTQLELFVNKGRDSRREWATLVRPPPNGILVNGLVERFAHGVGNGFRFTG